jgi:putative oxidoreductase
VPVDEMAQRFFASRVRHRGAAATAVLRVVVGLVFVLFSLPKFVLHEFELAEFVRFGLPASSLLVYAVGVLELVAGVMLVVGLGTRLAALGLAVNMVGAVATAGVQVGGPFHLGLAPALLVCLLFLLWTGAGAASCDRWLAVRLATRSSTPAPRARPTRRASRP